MIKKTVICIMLIYSHMYLSLSVSANSGFEQPIDTIFTFIYNRQFDKAEKELNLLQKKSDNIDSYILFMDLNWWKTVKKINVHDFEKFKIVLSTLEAKNEDNSDKSELKELILLSYSLRMAAHENHYIQMISYFNKINKLIEIIDNQSLPKNEKQIYELYKAILGIFKSKLIFYNTPGLQKKSIYVLEQNSKSSNTILKTISNYFLAKIYLEIEKSPKKSICYFEELNQMYPSNSIFSDYIKICEKSYNY